ncbi:MAG: hypothetical protein A2X05_08725 [Bacteroidetes bacterium GWE2_41_25]|nr:MAG: hypothetical protein A2X06_06335 [Bacteroidetes bacterium GWC2_40_22]OFY05077.1 MAG: hypothetical protein A2X05_08725 [Bacteroidetes bacterium GWE2_41_25]OFY59324.1 MAG: hypothetical protein A2X04_06805 [Bacteroidetes bacterium GWF2_41_9]HCU19810.1 hypothetical protein [Bacteroidales bacterium]
MERVMRFLKVLVVISYLTCFLPASGQEVEGMVKYTPEFKFRDGIYLDFEQVKHNNPIPKAKLLASFDYNDREFFRKIFEMDKIYYYDDIGVRQEVKKSDVWGYSRNGILYIQVQEGFNRITFVGNICHFVADITTEDSRYSNYPYSPYGYYDPYYSPYSYGSYYSPYSYYRPYYSPYNRNPSTRTELRQFIIDWETGKVMEFETDNTELLLMKDPVIYEEYARLSRSKKKDLMFVYIRKFNEKNPLYLPVE